MLKNKRLIKLLSMALIFVLIITALSAAVFAQETDDEFPGDAYTQVINEPNPKGEAEVAFNDVFCPPPTPRYQTINGGLYYIKNVATGTYLTASGGGYTSGTNVCVSALAGGMAEDAQKWQIVYYADTGYFFLRPFTSDPAHSLLDVNGNVNNGSYYAAGTNVQMFEHNTVYNSSQWAMQMTADGNYRFLAKMSYINPNTGNPYGIDSYKKYLAVDSVSANSNVSQRAIESNGSKSTWQLIRVSDSYTQKGWTFPLNSTSNYDRVSNDYKLGHYAVDLVNTYSSTPMGGKAVYAPQAGIVIGCGYTDEAQGFVTIRSNDWDVFNGNYLRYGFYHLEDPTNFLIPGQVISKGQVIGYVLGGGSNVHLHAFVTNNGEPTAPKNKITTYSPGTLNFARFYPLVGFERRTSAY